MSVVHTPHTMLYTHALVYVRIPSHGNTYSYSCILATLPPYNHVLSHLLPHTYVAW
jgi:hypothetical protein